MYQVTHRKITGGPKGFQIPTWHLVYCPNRGVTLDDYGRNYFQLAFNLHYDWLDTTMCHTKASDGFEDIQIE